MQVMNAISEILKREGVSTLFCFPTTPIIEAAVAAGIRPVGLATTVMRGSLVARSRAICSVRSAEGPTARTSSSGPG